MRARRVAALTAVSAGIGLLSAPSCGISTEPPCTAASAGFGDAATVTRNVLLELERQQGQCQPRVQLITEAGELGRVFRELDAEVPAIDFARERVVLREANHEAGVAWTVARGDVLTVGLQGCEGAAPTGCLIQIYSVSTPAARVETHTCKRIPCPGEPSPVATPLARPLR